jgi:hypothetical protein
MCTSYPDVLVGLEAVHVVGPSEAPGRQKLKQVNLHRLLHKHKVVLCHPEASHKTDTKEEMNIDR